MTLQKLMSVTRKGLDDFGMVENGEKIAVGVSGGKDSLALLLSLNGISKYHPSGFSVCAVTVDLGFEENDFSGIAEFCEGLGIEYRVEKTNIGKIVFDTRDEKNPCSLCSKMKRAVLCKAAKEMGATALALAHHKDDLIETFFMNLMYAGKIDTFLPVTYLEKTGIKVIRPFIYLEEKDVVYFANKNPLPITPSHCPADRNTSREKTKKLINSLSLENRDLKAKVFGAMERGGLFTKKDSSEEE